jgi:hypothetical protein
MAQIFWPNFCCDMYNSSRMPSHPMSWCSSQQPCLPPDPVRPRRAAPGGRRWPTRVLPAPYHLLPPPRSWPGKACVTRWRRFFFLGWALGHDGGRRGDGVMAAGGEVGGAACGGGGAGGPDLGPNALNRAWTSLPLLPSRRQLAASSAAPQHEDA